MVGVAGLEPAAFASRTQHSTKLSHTPIEFNYITFYGNLQLKNCVISIFNMSHFFH